MKIVRRTRWEIWQQESHRWFLIYVCKQSTTCGAIDMTNFSHLASNLTFAWRRPTSTFTILRVLRTVIIQSARVVESCKTRTDVSYQEESRMKIRGLETILSPWLLWRSWTDLYDFLVVCQQLFSVQPLSDACSTNAPPKKTLSSALMILTYDSRINCALFDRNFGIQCLPTSVTCYYTLRESLWKFRINHIVPSLCLALLSVWYGRISMTVTIIYFQLATHRYIDRNWYHRYALRGTVASAITANTNTSVPYSSCDTLKSHP